MTSSFCQLPNVFPSKFLAALKFDLSVMMPCNFLNYYIFVRRWREQVSSKRRLTRSRLHGVTYRSVRTRTPDTIFSFTLSRYVAVTTTFDSRDPVFVSLSNLIYFSSAASLNELTFHSLAVTTGVPISP